MVLNKSLLARFVLQFRFDEFGAWSDEPAPAVIQRETPHEALVEVNAALSAPLPPLFEQLLLTYRWPEADLGSFRLFANPSGPDLTGWLNEVRRDPVFAQELIPRGWIPFGKGPDVSYDPICFDLRPRVKSGYGRIVRLDHEELLCASRVREVAVLASDFEAFVRQIGSAGLS